MPGLRRAGGGALPSWEIAVNRLLALSPDFLYTAARHVTLDGSGNVSLCENAVDPTQPNDDVQQPAAGSRLGWGASANTPSPCPVFIGDGASYLKNDVSPAWIGNYAGGGAYTVAWCGWVGTTSNGATVCRGNLLDNKAQYEFWNVSSQIWRGYINGNYTEAPAVPQSAAVWGARQSDGAGNVRVWERSGVDVTGAVAGNPGSDALAIGARYRSTVADVPLGAEMEMGLAVGFPRVLSAGDEAEAAAAMVQYTDG